MKKGILFAALTAILFVTLEPVSALIKEDVTPFAITLWRFIIGSVMMLPFAIMKIKKEQIKITGKDIALIGLLGAFVICLSMIALQIGVKKADSPALIAIIFSSNSIFTILFSIFILKDKLTSNKIIALILGIIGVLLCADFSSGTNLESVAYAVFASLSFSLYTVLSKKFMKKFGGIIQTSFGFLFGSIALLIFLLIMGAATKDPAYTIMPSVINTNVILNLVYLGIFVTGLGYLFYFKAMEHGGAIMASFAFFIKPILTPFVSLIIVPEAKLSWQMFAAVVCIALASYFATYYKKKNS
ncbi:MAG: DMT family transporter [Ruminococcaceae bacterium]|nr:DMT family transporter [Oscillospiraceae bacterium]